MPKGGIRFYLKKFLLEFEELGVFERNKASVELKVLGLAFYSHLSSLRRAAKALSELHKVLRLAGR